MRFTNRISLSVVAVLTLVFAVHAKAETEAPELNPFAPNVEQTLKAFDQAYEEETGLSPWLDQTIEDALVPSCRRETCAVWAQVVKSSQHLNLYMNGQFVTSWLVSTGKRGFETPNFDRHPDGRIYIAYRSRHYPEGDYMGLGNMPYAVFIQGGFALHGTPESNWPRLGQKASHGCIRQHPDNALYFNQLVRRTGIRNVWITVQN